VFRAGALNLNNGVERLNSETKAAAGAHV